MLSESANLRRSNRGNRRTSALSGEEKKAAALLYDKELSGNKSLFNMLNIFLTPHLKETFPCVGNENLQHVHPNISTVPATVVNMFRSTLNLLEARLETAVAAKLQVAEAAAMHPDTLGAKFRELASSSTNDLQKAQFITAAASSFSYPLQVYIDFASLILTSCGFGVKMCIIKDGAFVNAPLPDKQIAIWQLMNSCGPTPEAAVAAAAEGRGSITFYETVDDMVKYQRPKAKKKNEAAYKIAFTSYVDSVTELAGILRKISLLGAP